MVNDWCELTLEESMDAIIDYRGKTPKKTDSGIPLITAKIIKSGRIETVNEFISEDDYDTWMRRGIPNEGDVVMTTEAPLGEIAQLDGRKIALAQRVITLRGKKDILDNTFLKYLMISEYVQHQLDGRGTGTTVKGIKQSELRKVVLKFPSFKEQKAIAHILGFLDDKIELNRQMNETLESMSQAFFKSWFVDFDPVIDNALAAGNAIPDELFERAEQRKEVEKKDHSDINTLFPDEFELTEGMGWIPKGWEVKSLSEVTENIFSGGTPNTKKAEYWNGGLKWFSSGETRESIVIETEKNITEIGVSESSTKLARYGDVLIASAGQGHTRGQTSFCSIDTYFNQSVVCVRPQKSIHYSWLFFNLYGRYEEMRGLSDSHSIRGSLTTKLLLSMLIIKPNENILAEYENIIGTHILKIKEKKLINNNIAKLRDTLLPKLMSGEIRIPDAEALVNESI